MRRVRRKNDLGWLSLDRVMGVDLVVLLLSALGCPQGFAQSPGNIATGRGSKINLERVQQLREDVDLWPLITHPKSDAELRVNATLTRLNNELSKSLRDCDEGVVEFEKGAGEPVETKDDLTRSVEVTMRGPRLLSLVATDEFFCGGAHPDDDLTVLVFDLKSGIQVDWSTLVAKSAGASSPKNTLCNAGGTRPLILPQLQEMYMAMCRESAALRANGAKATRVKAVRAWRCGVWRVPPKSVRRVGLA